MADKSSSQPIPKGWRFETKQKKDGSQVSYYFCPETGQRFYTYEDMMRYVNYAKEAGLPMYIPDFLSRKRKITDQSSESTDNQIEKSLDSNNGIGVEKSLDSEEGTDTESFDSEKTADAVDSDFAKDDPSEISVSEADIIPSEDPFIVEQAPMQAIMVSPPAVENPNPVNLPSEDPDIVEQAPAQAVMVNPPAVENPNSVNLPSEDPDIVEQAPVQVIMVNPCAVENPNPVNLTSEDLDIVEKAPVQAIMVNPPAVENPNPVNLPSEDPDIVEQAPVQAIMVNPPAVENRNPVNRGPAARNLRLPVPYRAFPRGGGGIRKPRPRMI